MDYSELKRLAEAATPGPWAVKEDSMNGLDEVYCSWHEVGPLSLIGEKLSKDTAYVAAASPDVVLGLIAAGERWREEWSEVCNENQVLINRNQALLEALKDAAKSLQTISLLAGLKDSNMDSMSDVRGYARSRCIVAMTAAIKLAEVTDV